MRISIRTSRWAIWARRIASIALPFELIAVIMHRQRMIPSDTFTLIFAIGLALAVLSIIVSLFAFVRLWRSGFSGWGRTFQALILGLVLASPIGVAISWTAIYPPTNDVATNGTLPTLSIARHSDARLLSREDTVRIFPTALARTYPLTPDKVFALAADLAGERQWDIRIRRRPVAPAYPGRLQALDMTFLGYRDEISILVDWSDSGAVVSMRSASIYKFDDFGSNGRRIEAFLSELDRAVTEELRREPIVNEPVLDDEDRDADDADTEN